MSPRGTCWSRGWCKFDSVDHLKQIYHRISDYMLKTAVVKDSDSGEYKVIPKCAVDSCANNDQVHRKNYWHPGDECLDPKARVSSIANATENRKLQTSMDPVYLKDVNLLNDHKPVKSLKELSLQNVAISINETPEDYVEYFQDLEREGAIPYLPYLTFPAMEKLVSLHAFDWMNIEGSFVEHCVKMETKAREMFVSDRMNKFVQDPHLMMTSVFNAMHKKVKQESQNDTLLFATEFKPGPALASRAQFKAQFQYLTGGIFDGIDMSNLFIAGGIVLAALQPFDPNTDLNEQLIEKGYYNSDIDVFVHGIDDVAVATERVRIFCKELKEKTGQKMLFVRNRNCLTIVREYPHRQIQVIFRLYQSPSEILIGFDIDCCSVGYDGKDVYGIPRFFAAASFQRNVVDVTRRSPSYEYRLYKYSKRGFGVLIPGEKLDTDLLEKLYNREREGSLTGLSRLVGLSKGSATRLYDRYDGSFNMEHLTDAEKANISQKTQEMVKVQEIEAKHLSYNDYIKFATGEDFEFEKEESNNNLFPDFRTAELIDIDRHTEQFSSLFSNYMTVKIPYSPNWSLERIRKFVRSCSRKFRMGRHYGPFMEMEVASRLIPDEDDEDFYWASGSCIEIVDTPEAFLRKPSLV
ncbi:hypothetical protein HK103_001766 [Boothiomyces macroporosus]|uniref:Uncharacterized protein n=1 Tax=Boothiomyces macroporosus TaxID=261099 RepID=A0AAD5Y9U4_9FUNG|nr:hypothetical protein HK103_001766 [Boothiomyces macroporosus]